MIVVQTPVKFFEDARKQTSTLDTGFKVAAKGVEAWKKLNPESVPEGINAVSTQFGVFSGIVGALNIGSRFYEWISPNVRKEWTWQKYTAQSGLTVANLFETILWGHKIGLWALGTVAAPLEIAKNIILLPVSFFNTWSSVNEIINAGKTLKHYEGRLKKWDAREVDDKFFTEGIPNHIATIQAEYKAEKAKKKIEKSKTVKEYSQKKVDDLTGRVHKLKARREKWNDIANQTDSKTYLEQICERKTTGYREVVKAAKHNKGKIQTKNWLATTNSVMKFVLGFIALGLLFAGVSIPVVAAAMAIAWAVTHIIGLAKDLYDMQPQNKPVNLKALVPSFA